EYRSDHSVRLLALDEDIDLPSVMQLASASLERTDYHVLSALVTALSPPAARSAQTKPQEEERQPAGYGDADLTLRPIPYLMHTHLVRMPGSHTVRPPAWERSWEVDLQTPSTLLPRREVD